METQMDVSIRCFKLPGKADSLSIMPGEHTGWLAPHQAFAPSTPNELFDEMRKGALDAKRHAGPVADRVERTVGSRQPSTANVSAKIPLLDRE
jgi:hypothetical protein